VHGHIRVGAARSSFGIGALKALPSAPWGCCVPRNCPGTPTDFSFSALGASEPPARPPSEALLERSSLRSPQIVARTPAGTRSRCLGPLDAAGTQSSPAGRQVDGGLSLLGSRSPKCGPASARATDSIARAAGHPPRRGRRAPLLDGPAHSPAPAAALQAPPSFRPPPRPSSASGDCRPTFETRPGLTTAPGLLYLRQR
jgi:hypothetical protein